MLVIVAAVGAVGAVGCAAFATDMCEEWVADTSPCREHTKHLYEGASLIRRRKEPAWELV